MRIATAVSIFTAEKSSSCYMVSVHAKNIVNQEIKDKWQIIIYGISREPIRQRESLDHQFVSNYLPIFAHCNDPVKICVYCTQKVIWRTLHNWARKSSIWEVLHQQKGTLVNNNLTLKFHRTMKIQQKQSQKIR